MLQYIRDRLDYDRDTGKLHWKGTGTLAGNSSIRNKPYGKPYRQLNILGHTYMAHRMVYLIEHGRWPVSEIDHIDGDTTNNRHTNLREATPVTNRRNQKRHSRNTTGHTGIHKRKNNGRYEASIGDKGKLVYIGSFTTYEEAVAARLEAERKLKYDPSHGKR
jgi:hypothetical protein